jgi:hypothetical protein
LRGRPRGRFALLSVVRRAAVVSIAGTIAKPTIFSKQLLGKNASSN